MKLLKINRPGYKVQCYECEEYIEGATEKDVLNRFKVHFDTQHKITKEETKGVE